MPERQFSNETAVEGIPRDLLDQALRDERLLLSSILENLPFGVGVYNSDGDLIHSNEYLRRYGRLDRLPSRQPGETRHWRAFDPEGGLIAPRDYPCARALRGEWVMPGIDFLCSEDDVPSRRARISAVPFRREAGEEDGAIIVVQDLNDFNRAGEDVDAAARYARQTRFLETTLSSIPDAVYAIDARGRFVYANSVMLRSVGLTAEEMIGRTFSDIGFPSDLARHLNENIARIFEEAVTVEDAVSFDTPTGRPTHFLYRWVPVGGEGGSVEFVVGVSRDTGERRSQEGEIKSDVVRLRAATELAGLGIYAWDPVTGALDWDDRLRAMWGLPRGAPVDMAVYEAGIHPKDLPRVRKAVTACLDPEGDGRYAIEYRVIGRDDQVTRHILTSGRAAFERGRAISFIGAAIDISEQRRSEAAVRASETQLRRFAENSIPVPMPR